MKTSYRVGGFKGSVIVDAESYEQAEEIAQAIAGTDYHFHHTENINHLIPDAAKNRLFTSDAELYAAAPEMNPKRRRR